MAKARNEKKTDERFVKMPRIGLDAQAALYRLKVISDSGKKDRREFLSEIPLNWSDTKCWEIFKNISGQYNRVTPAKLFLINRYLIDNNWISDTSITIDSLETFDDYLYFAMMRYFDADLLSEIETKSQIPGLYRLYRPSLKIPGHFTKGLFQITRDLRSDALCVSEIHAFKGGKGERAHKETFHGYIFRKRRRYLCMQRTTNKSNFLFTVFNDEYIDSGETEQVFSMGGVAYGTTGSRLYFSKVFVERCEPEVTEEMLLEEIDYVTRDEIPGSVERYLRYNENELFHIF